MRTLLLASLPFVFLAPRSSAQILPDTPTWEAEGTLAYEYVGTRAAGAGDVNGDGRVDLLVLARGAPAQVPVHGSGRVDLYLGEADGFATTPSWTVLGGNTLESLWWTARGIGDVNADGFADIAISTLNGNAGITYGSVHVFHGGPNGPNGGVDALVTEADWIVRGEHPHVLNVGCAVLGPGDLNADGVDDLLVGVERYTSADLNHIYEGAVFLFHGAAGTGLPGGKTATIADAAWWVQSDRTQCYLGKFLHEVGDVNADGNLDFAITGEGGPQDVTLQGRHWIYTSTAGQPGQDMGGAFATFGGNGTVSRDLAAADFDRDGFDDLVIAQPNVNYGGGVYEPMRLHRGTSNGFAPSSWTVASVPWFETAGLSLVAADLDADGAADLAVLSSTWAPPVGPATGRVRVFRGLLSGTSPLSVHAEWETPLWTPNGGHTAWLEAVGDPELDATETLAVANDGADPNGLTDAGRVSLFAAEGEPLDLCPAWTPDWIHAGLPTEHFASPHHVLGDFDGDGFDDLLVGENGSPQLRLFRGSPDGLAAAPGWQVDVPNPLASQYGARPVGVGDVNGDGADDALVLVTGKAYQPGSSLVYDPGTAYVFLGVPHTSSSGGMVLAWTASGLAIPPTYYAWSGTIADDLNGDGFDDVVIGARGHAQLPPIVGPDPFDVAGFVHVYHGDANGVNGGVDGHEFNAAWTASDGQPGSGFGARVGGLGDLDGDGFGDLLVSAPFRATGAGENVGKLYVWRGSAGGVNGGAVGSDANAWWSREGASSGETFGSDHRSGVDVTGDGRVDLATSRLEDGLLVIDVWPGTSTGFAATARVVPTGRPYGRYRLIPDFDGDGFGDFAFSTTNASGRVGLKEGRIEVFRGGPTWWGTGVASWRAYGGVVGAQLQLGTVHDAPGDVNGDGRTDLIGFAPGLPPHGPGGGVMLGFHGTAETLLEATPSTVAPGDRVTLHHYGGEPRRPILLVGTWTAGVGTPGGPGTTTPPRPLLAGVVDEDACWTAHFVVPANLSAGEWTLRALQHPGTPKEIPSNEVTVTVP